VSGRRSTSKKPPVRSLWILLMGMVMSQCGVIGPPVAPEDVGVAPIIERQKKREAERLGSQVQPAPRSDKEPMMEPGEPLPVPPLRQMGTR
jgi:hypothetical protein